MTRRGGLRILAMLALAAAVAGCGTDGGSDPGGALDADVAVADTGGDDTGTDEGSDPGPEVPDPGVDLGNPADLGTPSDPGSAEDVPSPDDPGTPSDPGKPSDPGGPSDPGTPSDSAPWVYPDPGPDAGPYMTGGGATGDPALTGSVPLGTPLFDLAEVLLFVAPCGHGPDLPGTFPTMQQIVPGHGVDGTLKMLVPGTPHAPPYDHELSDGLAALGITTGNTVDLDHMKAPSCVFVVALIVPGAGAPVGKTADFDSGPMIGPASLPLTARISMYWNTSTRTFLNLSIPQPSKLDPPVAGEGYSHLLVVWAFNMDVEPKIQYTTEVRPSLRVTDPKTNGWNAGLVFSTTNQTPFPLDCNTVEDVVNEHGCEPGKSCDRKVGHDALGNAYEYVSCRWAGLAGLYEPCKELTDCAAGLTCSWTNPGYCAPRCGPEKPCEQGTCAIAVNTNQGQFRLCTKP